MYDPRARTTGPDYGGFCLDLKSRQLARTGLQVGKAIDFSEDVLTELAQVCGKDIVDRLRRALGGFDIKIPRREASLTDNSPLVLAVGREDALKIVRSQVARGETIYIRHPLKDRDRPYLDAMNEGLDNAEIAKRFGVSERHARRVLQRCGVRNPNCIVSNHRRRPKSDTPAPAMRRQPILTGG